MYILCIVLEYLILGYIFFLLALPLCLLVGNMKWYIQYKVRKEARLWESISKFFEEHEREYSEAASSWRMACFWHGQEGYDTMYKIKKIEYEAYHANIEEA